ncbi:MAG TPA: bifunctional methylenetetrahydrofolate dehydrogenase/methenyltetrahydrofolate cyclohydrolase FolD [Sedimentisphaerales bacterium]|nr:bifunctional methylenetetrahydrofolate dehydrogenase/methenyltetrahydrofolate cyclohydrolase FolD [Sedimentisphaerales bacterium]HRS10126.1 bifunctional methylenetetrahydrofolate dehydrogenase/methenyltetrahydrofolate cyclohydrolase FolD [Sedimentisphaerales bacterium]HRV46832.1 bifunctional methylenetetrahydrofolate dehydrogenase/methenyltetrahydrofolate cyclohydrolase FolD [Sedimentisphaerales bacterium]
MTARIIDGKQVAADIRAELKAEITALKAKGIVPGLGVILVGDDPASVSYVTGKERTCDELGIYSDHNHLPRETSQAELKRVIERLNDDSRVNGILVQLPLPKHLSESEAIFTIDPAKDVDGIHPVSVGKMVTGERAFLSCTPHGVLQLLTRSGVKIEGSHVVIVGRSNLVGRPLANMLIQKSPLGNATVTVCHTRTRDLAYHTRQADILVAAAGSPNTITADMVRDGAVVIDVGVNRVEDPSRKQGYRLVGDVDFEAVKAKASLITPVPGGVGPMTITMLMYNTVLSAKRAAGLV